MPGRGGFDPFRGKEGEEAEEGHREEEGEALGMDPASKREHGEEKEEDGGSDRRERRGFARHHLKIINGRPDGKKNTP
jgi:hypothetical protein